MNDELKDEYKTGEGNFMDSKIQKVIQAFKDKHDLHVVIVYGSYARGDFSPASDLDLLGIKIDTHDFTDTSFIDGVQLDGWITSTQNLSDLDHHIKLLGGMVFIDQNNIGKNLLDEVANHFKKGPKLLSQNEKAHIISWMDKMLRRAQVGDIEGNYRRTWLLNDLLKYYFELRDEWYLGPKLAFKTLKDKDPETFCSYEKCLKNPADLMLLQKLLSEVSEVGK